MQRHHRAIAFRPLTRAGNDRAVFGLALLLAAMLHALFLLLPGTGAGLRTAVRPAHFRLRLTTVPPTTAPQVAAKHAASGAEPASGVPQRTAPAATVASPAPPRVAPEAERDKASASKRSRLARRLLSRQYLPADPTAVPYTLTRPEPAAHDTGRGFHFPARANMLSMLDRPLPDLPFGYTPGLVRFAYDPGMRGEMQRFWDTITPEFGWTTRHGTEVRCIWVLVVVACGWK